MLRAHGLAVPPGVYHMTTIQMKTREHPLCPTQVPGVTSFPRGTQIRGGSVESWGSLGQEKYLGSGGPCFRE